ncbi:MAG: MraY family glycosyltransferase [Victivallaceae bacterium]
MSHWYWNYFFIFTGTLALSLMITPLFRMLAEKVDLMDRPKVEAHKGHGKATPLLGGAAMFTAWFVALGAGVIVMRSFPGVASVSWRLFFLVLGAFLAMLLGLLDDKLALKAGPKFAGQFLVALVAVTLGGASFSAFCPWPWVGTAASVFWFMLLMNSINFFDNMDGLAVGTVTIALGLFAVVAGLNEQYFVASFAALGSGAAAGFWYYNRAPAMIFMGDSGSHFLGYLAAVTSCLVTYFNPGQSLSRFPVLAPLFILAVPLFDTLMVVIIRYRLGKPFWIGDHNHISHRFTRIGLTRPRAVLLVHLMALAIGLGIFPVMWGDFSTAAVVVAQALLLLLIVSIMQFSLATKK